LASASEKGPALGDYQIDQNHVVFSFFTPLPGDLNRFVMERTLIRVMVACISCAAIADGRDDQQVRPARRWVGRAAHASCATMGGSRFRSRLSRAKGDDDRINPL
jgi:hypothetical protein